jgi:3-deoxy-D-manno-oct-2-ulosonic acid (Kdo) hydroxylase
MAWIEVTDYRPSDGGFDSPQGAERAAEYCRELEQGAVLFFAGVPFDFPLADREFLLSQKQSGFKGHKNISYRPADDILRGDAAEDQLTHARLHEIMRNYSQQVVRFATHFLAPYAGKWSLDFASFRSIEEHGRDLALHKRNDLTHIDAFPTRPTHGGRILRVFTNINPTEPRVWEVTDRFPAVAGAFAKDAGLMQFAADSPGRKVSRLLGPMLKTVGVKGADRSAYDRFMLHFHDYLKEHGDYQTKWPKTRIEFPPNSTWLVYTDTVPHAVLSGQFALEQTFIIPVSANVTPASAPISVLEQLCGCPLSA